MLLQRFPGHLAGGGALVPAEDLGGRPRAPAAGPRARGRQLPDQARAGPGALDQARAWGVPHRCLVADADYGDNPNVLAGLEARQERYVVGVRTDFPVRLRPTASTRVWRADDLLETVPRWQ